MDNSDSDYEDQTDTIDNFDENEIDGITDEEDKEIIEKNEEDTDDDEFEELITSKRIIIPKKNRISRPILTKYEKTRLLSIRIHQLNQGALAMVDTNNCKNSIEIANKELYEKKIPLTVQRPLGNNKFEEFKISELTIL